MSVVSRKQARPEVIKEAYTGPQSVKHLGESSTWNHLISDRESGINAVLRKRRKLNETEK